MISVSGVGGERAARDGGGVTDIKHVSGSVLSSRNSWGTCRFNTHLEIFGCTLDCLREIGDLQTCFLFLIQICGPSANL